MYIRRLARMLEATSTLRLGAGILGALCLGLGLGFVGGLGGMLGMV